MTVAIGFFDGVHLGHQEILRGADVALTFANHPLTFLAPGRAPHLIMSREERESTIRRLGVRVETFDFNAELAQETPENFLAVLRKHVRLWARQYRLAEEPLTIRSGANWHFGRGGIGDAAWLRAHGVDATVVPFAVYKGQTISSTRIRQALEAGEIDDANAMMGRRFAVRGLPFRGKGEGAGLGYPTVNVRPEKSDIRLPLGVYAVCWAGETAIANYGHAPTFGARAWPEPVWEIHFLATPTREALDRIESASCRFGLLHFVRPERKFDSPEDLKRQIALDCATILV